MLPDKAIDLIDEAGARLKMQIDSKPEELDNIDREIIRLKIEQEALKKETDSASKDRLERLEKELVELEEKGAALTAKWQAERDKLESARGLKEKLEDARNELDAAKRSGNLARAGELSYGIIPQLEQQLAEIVGPEARFVHQGMTSSDVLDTCFNIQLTRAADLLIADVDGLLAALKRRAMEHKEPVCVGRSHGTVP